MLVRVVAPHLVAGIVLVDGRCTEAAPILRWCIGKDRAWLRAWFEKRGWRASVILD